MNRLEKIAHNAVGDYPWIKDPLVYIYQGLLSLFPAANYAPYGMPKVKPGFFYGFHDTSPWSLDGEYILSHKFSGANVPTEPGSGSIEFGFFDRDDLESFKVIGSTTTWNWQQGASLQWIHGHEALFTVNNLAAGRPEAQIWHLSGEIRRRFSAHLANCSPDGRYGVSYCFGRLSKGMPGYGYSNIPKAAETDELSVIDLSSGHKMACIRLPDLANASPAETMDGAYHFFSHALFSPSSDRFLFYHRWRQPTGVLNTRLYSVDIHGKDLFLYPGRDYSHLAWKNEREVLAYCRGDGRNWGYYMLKDGIGEAQRVGESFFKSDGHPQFHNDGDTFVTDSYPDRFRQQKLFTFRVSSGVGYELLRLKIPFRYRREQRCDFHPRWSPNGKAICFDSAHEGVRALCILPINS